MNNSEKTFKDVIKTQYFAVLNTLENGIPYSNLVSFAITDDFKSLIFFTPRATRKFRNIQGNRNVSLLIDNRTNTLSDVSRAIAITVLGAAQDSQENRSDLRDIFLARHPHLQQFADAPGNALILVTVSEYIIADFEQTHRFIIS